jgi:predicted transport protein
MTFKDPQKLTGDKVYKGWFFKQGQEREFKVTSKEQIPYAMELIKQSYDISGEEMKWKV